MKPQDNAAAAVAATAALAYGRNAATQVITITLTPAF